MAEQANKTLADETVLVNMKHRLTGAVIWLGVLVIVVPIWYSNPVNFSAQEAQSQQEPGTILAKTPFLLPEQSADDVSSQARKIESVESTPADSVANNAKQTNQTEQAAAISSADNVEANSNSKWIIRLVAYRKKDMAEGLKQRLHYDYEAYVKHFPKSNYYSVRVGPYHSQAEAEKDQKSLNRILRIQSELVKVQ